MGGTHRKPGCLLHVLAGLTLLAGLILTIVGAA
jgi:hypothetical protein